MLPDALKTLSLSHEGLERKPSVSDHQSFEENTSNIRKASDELFNVLRARVQQDRNAIDEYVLLGRLLRYRGHAKRAFYLHQSLLARSDLDRHHETAIYLELGLNILSGKIGDFGEQYFLKVLEYQKHNVGALEGLIQSLELQERYEGACQQLIRLVRLGRPEKTHLAYVYSALGLQYLQNSLHGKARRAAEKAIETDENCPYAHYSLAEVLAATEHYDAAIERLQEFVRRWPRLSFLALRKMEDAHFRKNDFPGYEMSLRECLRHDPDNAVLHYSLGRHLRKKRKFSEAQECFERSLELNPMYVNAIRDHVRVLTHDGKLHQTQEQLEAFFSEYKKFRFFVCPRCHHKCKDITWHCPSCNTWSVFDVRYELPTP